LQAVQDGPVARNIAVEGDHTHIIQVTRMVCQPEQVVELLALLVQAESQRVEPDTARGQLVDDHPGGKRCRIFEQRVKRKCFKADSL